MRLSMSQPSEKLLRNRNMAKNFQAETPRLITDRMLGRLSTWLRILGHDTVYAADTAIEKGRREDEDNAIATFAASEARILLTRDKNLAAAARRRGVQCLQIKTDKVMEQLQELLRHNLSINLEPVPVRCSKCNALIRPVSEEEEENILILKEEKKEKKEKKSYYNYVPTSMMRTGKGKEKEKGKSEFWICERCCRIYWEGSHWQNMRKQLRQLKL